MPQYYKIGKLVASYGFQGQMVLKHSLGKKTSLKGLEKFFIEETGGSFLPYFMESGSGRDEDETLLKIEGIDTKESARRLMQREVWLEEADFQKFSAKSAPITFLGYMLMEDGEPIGEVLEVIEQPHQVLCKILYKGNEALIPLHQETLVSIDKKKKIIHLQLPEGLLDIYAG